MLATSNSYAFRYMYTNSIYKFYAVTSLRDKDIENPNEDNILAYNGDTDFFPTSYSIQSFFIRSGIDFDLPDETFTGFNILLMNLDYKEQPTNGSSSLKRLGATSYVRRTFGEYVSFGARITYLRDNIDGNLNSNSFSSNNDDFVFGFEGAIVF